VIHKFRSLGSLKKKWPVDLRVFWGINPKTGVWKQHQPRNTPAFKKNVLYFVNLDVLKMLEKVNNIFPNGGLMVIYHGRK